MSRRFGFLLAAALAGSSLATAPDQPTPARATQSPATQSPATQSPATQSDVQAWLQAVDDARNAFGEAFIKARATQFDQGKQTGGADFDIYVKGRDKALIVFRGGKNDGRKALTVGEKMWLIVPGAQNAVPITPNQRLLGGASFGDVARLRFAEDFKADLRPGTELLGGRVCHVLDLTAVSPKAPFPKVTLWIDAEGPPLPRKLLFLLPSGKPARQVTFTQFKKFQGKTCVSEMEVQDLVGPQTKSTTKIEYLDIKPAQLDDGIFTPDGARALA